MEKTIYTPDLAQILEIRDETPDTITLRLRFIEEKKQRNFSFIAGQFGLYSVFGEGESAFCISSPTTWKEYFECCFRVVGRVTKALHLLDMGSIIGFRGPYGNGFPLEQWQGKNLLFIAGGIGLPPLRTVIWTILDPSYRQKYANITIVYGARSVNDLLYKREISEWERRGDVKLIKTVDPGGETEDWDGEIGLVPNVLERAALPSFNTIALVCGPSIMIKFTLPVLTKLGFDLHNVYTTLENKMKCGLGKCGRCNVGNFYVCKEGPVISAAHLKQLPPEY